MATNETAFVESDPDDGERVGWQDGFRYAVADHDAQLAALDAAPATETASGEAGQFCHRHGWKYGEHQCDLTPGVDAQRMAEAYADAPDETLAAIDRDARR